MLKLLGAGKEAERGLGKPEKKRRARQILKWWLSTVVWTASLQALFLIRFLHVRKLLRGTHTQKKAEERDVRLGVVVASTYRQRLFFLLLTLFYHLLLHYSFIDLELSLFSEASEANDNPQVK